MKIDSLVLQQEKVLVFDASYVGTTNRVTNSEIDP